MVRKSVSYGATLLLIGAVMFATPAFGWAQRGGRGGGGHFGGGHIGGGHIAGGHFGGGNFGGARIGGFRGGLNHFGSPRYGYGYYGGYGSYYPYYDAYPYAGSSPAYDLGYYGDTRSIDDNYVDVIPPPIIYQASYGNTDIARDTTAHLTVEAPADAVVWFDGTKMKTPGSLREYQTPTLTPGSQYTYEVRARWNENGREVTQTQEINIAAGSRVNVHFPVGLTNAAPASPAKQD
jgi:uncharacterized protein (TIGR03000 family)